MSNHPSKQAIAEEQQQKALARENQLAKYARLLSHADAEPLLIEIAKAANRSAIEAGLQSNQTFANAGQIAFAKDLVSHFRMANFEAWQKIELIAYEKRPAS